MDDLEFQQRAHSDPSDTAGDLHAAAAANPQRTRLIEQLKTLDQEITRVLHGVGVPDMRGQLKALATAAPIQAATGDASAASSERSGETQTTDNVIPLHSRRKPALPRYFAAAASLVVAVALTMVLSPGAGPNAQDMAFHDQLISHVYAEEPRYDDTEVTWQQVSQTVADAGGYITDEDKIKALPVKFAKMCGLESKGRGAHLVLQGSKGPVSVFLIKGESVAAEFPVTDKRFAGRIVPMGDGNLVIIGEKDESLDDVQRLISENFAWNI